MVSCPICEKTYDDHVARCSVDGATLLRGGPPADPFIGLVIRGRYRVLKKLGQGGMGSVYFAEQMAVSRNVALKVVHGDFARDAEFVKRFRLEARLAASLNHRNVVTIYDFDQAEDGSLFIAMEYLNGRTLAEVVRQDGVCAVERALRLSLQIAQGLEAAHSAGVIHRDIKPQNIMVLNGEDQIKLMDFGIARLSDVGGPGLTRTGVVMGTPAYMSPEQIEGGEITRQTDVYAFGVVLYELLTGRVPFAASTASSVLVQHLREPPRPARSLNARIPEAVDRVVLHVLEKSPDARPRGMTAVIAELSAASAYVDAAGPGTGDIGATVIDVRSREEPTMPAASPESAEVGDASLPTIARNPADQSGRVLGAPRSARAARHPGIKPSHLVALGGVLFLVAGAAATVHFSGVIFPGRSKGVQIAEAPAPQQSPVVHEPAPLVRPEPGKEIETFKPEDNKRPEAAVGKKSEGDERRRGDKALKGRPVGDKPQKQPENRPVASLKSEDGKRPKDSQAPLPGSDTKEPSQETKSGQGIVSPAPSADEIRRQVEQKLRASGFAKLLVTMGPDNTVTLMGGLESQELREEARRLARSIEGVRDVKDIILVTPPGTTTKVR